MKTEACPFCGYNTLYSTTNGVEEWCVECANCGASGPTSINRERAYQNWNDRKPPDPEPRKAD